MTGRLYGASLLAVMLVAVLLTAALTPVCAMPNCEDVSVGACSDFKPACNKCPQHLVMKHSHDEAAKASSVTIDHVLPVAQIVTPDQPALVAQVLAVSPEAAAPPPLDPLGVRLTL